MAWLRGHLAQSGFDVAIVSGGADPEAALEKAASRISPGDLVVVHLSGRLSDGGGALAFGAGRSVPLASVAGTLGAREPAELAFVGELLHPDDSDDASAGAACLEVAVSALRSPIRSPGPGSPTRPTVLVALRPLAARVARLAFTERTLVARDAGLLAPSPDALVRGMHDRARADSDLQAVAPWLAFAPSGPQEPAAPEVLPDRATAPEASSDDAAVEAGSSAAVDAWMDAPSIMPPPVASSPSADPDVDARIAEASDHRDWRRVLELRLTRLGILEDASLQVRELIAIARLLQGELGDPEGAIGALEQARTIEPERASVLRALRRGYEALGRWAGAVEVIGVLSEMAAEPVERAALRVAQAKIVAERIGDEARAEEWLRAALQDDPSNAEALERLTRLRAGPSEADVIIDAEPSANPLPGREAVQSHPGIDGVALADLEAMAANAPLDPAAYARAHFLYLQDANTDAAFLAAMALEELGAADADQQALVDHFRSVSPVRARASLDPAAWELLRAPGFDDVLAAIFVAIERAAIAVRIEDLREQRRLPTMDREQRLSETSTASIVRSFQWAARFLGITCPDLYVVDGAAGVAPLQAAQPSTALGPAVLSGQSAKDLAFLAGHHLTRYRPEYRVLSYYPTREDVTMLLFAAAQLGMPPGGASDGAGSVRSLRTRLARHLGERERTALIAAVARLDARGGQATIGAWIRSMELTAARAGLLLSGDLMTASALVRSERCAVADPPLDTRRGDIVAFCASRAHAELRARFVTSAGSSVRHTDSLTPLAERIP